MYPFIAPYPKEAFQRSLGVEEAWPTPGAQGSGRPAATYTEGLVSMGCVHETIPATGKSEAAGGGADCSAQWQETYFFQQQQQQQQTPPVLLRMGEEYFLRLGNLNKRPVGSFSASSSSTGHLQPEASASNFFRAAMQQLQQLPERSLGSPEQGEAEGEAVEREKRSEEPPISLDLTFHLLREVLEMARAEQLAQQAHSNRKLMEIIGK
ncbi:PREDICTED: corticoliberin [Aptenodytes forsteri]|uniref:corticoliberin n=1 Tax=Aptenodytes forsteri TaxID=9233 RepID=UPI0004F3FFAE|nr:PREDICTED: corticoliberin [Aptenodytes forsteri]